ncbi:MAG: peptide ABC transporter substrate-binding protein [Alphaproteobacteria bacterium]|nr:peptide ABC transporter substrate-binding protein [Alphaproteobacteria bacterium]
MPTLRALAFALLALIGLTGPVGAKDELVIGITQFPSTLHPSIDSMMAKSYVLGMARRPFTAHDAQWRLVCMLCVELPTLENGLAKIEGKGIALTYAIQPKATWGDGTPVTSKDVVFAWKVGREPTTGLANQELYTRITSIDVLDERTFTLHVDRLTFDYNAIHDLDVLPAHLEAEAFARPAEYNTRTTYQTNPTHPGLWFGPYRVAEVSRGSHIVLEPNPTWWGAKPAFRRIVVKAIENTQAMEANLLSGSIDMIAGELGLSVEQALAFEKRNGARFAVTYKPALFYEHIDMNLSNPALADRRVRQALLLGLDRETMTRQLFEGRQPVAHGMLSPLDSMHAEVTRWPHDPTRAAALLDEAGWKGAPRRNAKGEPLALELVTTAGNRTRELVEQVLQSQWRKLGVDIRIRNEPARVLFGETLPRRRLSGMALYAWISSPENVPRSTLHSSMIPAESNGWSGQNTGGYVNPEADRLIDAIEIELDEAKRRVLWRALQEIYATDLPALPLFWRAEAHVLPLWLKGVTPTGHLGPTTLWVETWRPEG